jgi:hypothetical protein
MQNMVLPPSQNVRRLRLVGRHGDQEDQEKKSAQIKETSVEITDSDAPPPLNCLSPASKELVLNTARSLLHWWKKAINLGS